MRIPEPLLPYVAAGVIEETDAVAADVLVDIAHRDAARSGGPPTAPSPVAWLGMCLALRGPRDGPTGVELDDARAWAGDPDVGAGGQPPWPAWSVAERIRSRSSSRLAGGATSRSSRLISPRATSTASCRGRLISPAPCDRDSIPAGPPAGPTHPPARGGRRHALHVPGRRARAGYLVGAGSRFLPSAALDRAAGPS